MKRKTLKITVALLVCAFTLLALIPLSTVVAEESVSPVQQEIGTNLLANPGFEGFGKPQNNSLPNPSNWTRETFTGEQRGEIMTPEGWVTWWQGGDFKVPECKVIPNEAPFNGDPKRIYQGYYSGLCFAFWGKMNAGYYQVVRNIPPGSTVEGSFYAHAWSCSDSNPPLSCGDPSAFYFRVGIDPNGGTDPFSGNIVWSNAYFNYDKYGLVGPVQATVGQSGAATMFIQAYAKWNVKHNDAYYDSPTLKLVSAGETPTNTPPPPPPTSEIPPTPQYTPTPRPDGAIVHTVVSGDTLFGIALAYDVPVDDIYELNNINSSTLLQIGQEIVIAVSGGALPTPTPQPEATEESTPEVEPTQDSGNGAGDGMPAAPAQDKASLCTLAFYDSNGDMFRQAESGEMLLPNVQLSLLGRSGPVDDHKTDGISEPWCFEDLEPGNYVLRHTPPTGYRAIDGGQLSFILSGGQAFNIELAYVRDENAPEDASGDTAAPSEGEAEGESGEEDPGRMTNVLNTVLRVSGIIVLILAIAVAVLFVLSRRAT
jgi:LysM repeat protein